MKVTHFKDLKDCNTAVTMVTAGLTHHWGVYLLPAQCLTPSVVLSHSYFIFIAIKWTQSRVKIARNPQLLWLWEEKNVMFTQWKTVVIVQSDWFQ